MYNLVLYQSYLVRGMDMQKTAQKMRWRDSIRENVGLINPVKGLEEYFDPEFKDIMVSLRHVDNQIRAQILGKAVAGTEPVDAEGNALMADNVPSVKDLLKSASSNFDNFEYMKVVADISRFDERLASVSQMLEKLDAKMDKVQMRFLFDKDNEEYSEHLRALREKFKKKQEEKETKAFKQYELVVEAGFIDFIKNISNDRRKALYHWEKKYPKRVKVLKSDTKSLISKANSLYDQILKTLKGMSSARASREVDKYNELSAKIISGYKSFHEYFVQYYDKNVRKFLDKYWADSKETKPGEMAEQDVKPEEKDSGSEGGQSTMYPVSTAPGMLVGTPAATIMGPTGTIPGSPEMPPAQYEDKSLEPSNPPATMAPPSEPSASSHVAPAPDQNIGESTVPLSQEEEANRRFEAERKRQLAAARERRSQRSVSKENANAIFNEIMSRPVDVRFESNSLINSLQKMSNESPLVLKGYLAKYANTIKTSDPGTYKKLMAIINAIEV